MVCADNRNLPAGSVVPDIVFKLQGKKIYWDVGISNDANKYFAHKTKKYSNAHVEYEVHPIIFQKDCLIHPESLKEISRVGCIKLEELYEVLGVNIANSVAICKSMDKQNARLPEEDSIDEVPSKSKTGGPQPAISSQEAATAE